MDNSKVKIDVTISHFVLGQGIQCTSEIDPFYMEVKDLEDWVEVRKAIDEYCAIWAENTIRYNADEQDYIVEFWRGSECIGKALLSDYAGYMTD